MDYDAKHVLGEDASIGREPNAADVQKPGCLKDHLEQFEQRIRALEDRARSIAPRITTIEKYIGL